MPNWVYCNLKIVGDEKSIKEFKEFAEGYPACWDNEDIPKNVDEEVDEDVKKFADNLDQNNKKEKLCFNKFVTQPDELRGKPYADVGYHWQIKNYGTKWSVNSQLEEIYIKQRGDEHELEYIFNTAWSPPIPVFGAMVSKFKNLKFYMDYKEESESYNGYIYGAGGKIIEHSCSEE